MGLRDVSLERPWTTSNRLSAFGDGLGLACVDFGALRRCAGIRRSMARKAAQQLRRRLEPLADYRSPLFCPDAVENFVSRQLGDACREGETGQETNDGSHAPFGSL